MDKKTFTGLFLVLLILVGSTYFLKPSQEEINKEKTLQDSIAQVKKNPQTNTPATVTYVDSSLLKEPFGQLMLGKEAFITLENDELKILLSNKGGRIYSVELKKQKNYLGKPVILFEGDENRFGLNLTTKTGKVIATNDLYFSIDNTSPPNLQANSTEPAHISLKALNSNHVWIIYNYTLPQQSGKVGFDIQMQGLNEILASQPPITLDWKTQLKQQEKDIKYERQYSSLYFKPNEGDVDWLSESSDEQKNLETKTDWISFKQRFFTSVLMSKTPFEKGSIEIKTANNNLSLKSYHAKLNLAPPALNNHYQMEFFFGINKFKVLQAQGHDLEKQVRLGWLFLKWINRIAVIPVFSLLESFNLNYGIIILILTLLLKLVLSPLTYKSYLSMAKMRILKPELDEIKAKVGGDNPTLVQQEYLKLYRKAGVNPLGGCLPLVLQLPITIAFFYFFPNLFELRGKSFLWMHDLSTYDAVITFPAIPFLGWDHISLMCLLMTISTLIYTYFNNQISGVSGEMKYLGYITPFIFLGVLNSYPAGLNFYYFCANMLTFLQQYLIRKMVDENKIHAQIQENKKKTNEGTKKKSRLQQRMEEYMRQQQIKKK